MSIFSDAADFLFPPKPRSDYGILNFGCVLEGKVYRGGQPSRDGWLHLKSLGISYVLKLNYPDEGLDDAPDFKVIDCRMPPRDFWQAIGAPDRKAISAAMLSLADESNQPIYVHCLHGQDRTGLIIGMFRVTCCGWAPDAAYKEMLRFGFHRELHDLHEAWENFAGRF